MCSNSINSYQIVRQGWGDGSVGKWPKPDIPGTPINAMCCGVYL